MYLHFDLKKNSIVVSHDFTFDHGRVGKVSTFDRDFYYIRGIRIASFEVEIPAKPPIWFQNWPADQKLFSLKLSGLKRKRLRRKRPLKRKYPGIHTLNFCSLVLLSASVSVMFGGFPTWCRSMAADPLLSPFWSWCLSKLCPYYLSNLVWDKSSDRDLLESGRNYILTSKVIYILNIQTLQNMAISMNCNSKIETKVIPIKFDDYFWHNFRPSFGIFALGTIFIKSYLIDSRKVKAIVWQLKQSLRSSRLLTKQL